VKRTLVRRQVLKLVAGMALSPWPLPAASAQADRVQQTMAALLAATEEGSILQIDLEDLRYTLNLCGCSPLSFTVTDQDADKVLDACREALAWIPKHKLSAAVVVCSGYGKNFRLGYCAEVFKAAQRAMDESACLVFGAVFDPMLVDAMSVTWLVGAPDY
jgi:cell division GTPase FtsZ